MNNKFVKRLTGFLEMECEYYGVEYSYEWCSDCKWCNVTLNRFGDFITIPFRYDEEKDDLSLDMYEDNWKTVREFDWTVKYFWMVVSPVFFSVKS